MNCGLMQAGKGSKPFDPSNPQQSIYQMIKHGVEGTGDVTAGGYPGLSHYIHTPETVSWANIVNPGNPFEACRAYNSGHLHKSGNLDKAYQGSTSAYVNDIANRLTGQWDGSGNGCVQVACGLKPQSGCQTS